MFIKDALIFTTNRHFQEFGEEPALIMRDKILN